MPTTSQIFAAIQKCKSNAIIDAIKFGLLKTSEVKGACKCNIKSLDIFQNGENENEVHIYNDILKRNL